MNILIPAIVSFLITLISIPLTIKFAKKNKLLDKERHVPRAGGLAIFLGIVLSILIFIPLEIHTLGIICGLIILLMVGLLDDKYKNLSPYFRLITQFAAGFVIVLSGIGINFVTNPLGGIIYLGPTVSDILAIFWIVWVMNMIN